jgi:hypothetical protein
VYDPVHTITRASHPAPLVGGVGRTQYGSLYIDPKETQDEPGPDVYRSMAVLNSGCISKFATSQAFSMGPASRRRGGGGARGGGVAEDGGEDARNVARARRRRQRRRGRAAASRRLEASSASGQVAELSGGSHCTYSRGGLTPPRPLSRQSRGPTMPRAATLEELLPKADLDDSVRDMRASIWRKICGRE